VELTSGIKVVIQGGEGSKLVTESFLASRDVLVIRVHQWTWFGNKKDFENKLDYLWRGVPELDGDYPLDQDRRSLILLSFRKAVKEYHPGAFESRAKLLHPDGRPWRFRLMRLLRDMLK